MRPLRRPLGSGWGVLVGLGLISCAPADDSTQAGGAGPGWSMSEASVLFERRDQRGTVLYRFDRRSGEEHSVMSSGSSDWSGRLSPGGRRLLFNSLRDGNYEVYVGAPDGGSARNLSRHPEFDIVGAWRPDGGAVAYMSTRGYELGGEFGPFPGHIYVSDTLGVETRRVTRAPMSSSFGPTDWSPDGRSLTMARSFEGQVDVVLVDVDTGEERRVTSGPAAEYGATFSPDGSRLAFHADAGTESQIVVTDLDGRNRRVVTRGEVDYEPRWSPDGEWLLFTRRGGAEPEQYDVVAVRVEDGTVEVLVATEADERAGGWFSQSR